MVTKELLQENRRINLYLSGDITITSTHRRTGQSFKLNSSFGSHARKGYCIKKSTRRNLISSAFLLFVKKQHQIIFLTLTFPERIQKKQKINPMLHKFLTNMHETYGMKDFLWTREDQKSGRPHYHLLADMPFQPIKKINDAWCHAIGMKSNNAVRLPKDHKAILKDLDRTCRYITKYVSKNEKGDYSERCFSISKNIKIEPIRISEFDLEYINIDFGKDLKYRYYDHCTTIKIWDFFKKSDYFIEFLGNHSEINETLPMEGDQSKMTISPKIDRDIGLSALNGQFYIDYG